MSAETVDPKETSPRGRRIVWTTLLVLAGGALLASKVPLCPVALATGHPCPGCGLTRASLAALRGDLAGAYAMHPLVFVIAPLMAITLVLGAHAYVMRGRIQLSPRVHRYLMPPLFVAYALALGLWILRFEGYFGGPVPVDAGVPARVFGLLSR